MYIIDAKLLYLGWISYFHYMTVPLCGSNNMFRMGLTVWREVLSSKPHSWKMSIKTLID